MSTLLVRIITNGLGLYIAQWLVPGFVMNGGLKEYVLAALVLALLNMLVKPLVKLISLPLIVLTLGLFTIVINALMLWVVDYQFSFVVIHSYTALFLATLVVSAVNMLSNQS
jgi:putative membrane protein